MVSSKSLITGKTILFSGTFHGYSRKELEKLAISNGAILLNSVSHKLQLLIAGDDMGPAKYLKAGELDIPMISLYEFLTMIGEEKAKSSVSDQSKSATSSFFVEINPEDSEEKLLIALKSMQWENFEPLTQGYFLRDFLQKHENKHGVTQVHLFVSESIKKHLTLMHPYGHEERIDCSSVSPDKKYLATGSVSEDYERGGVLQIWEIETGRVVNRLRIKGGVGWSDDYKAFEWHLSSQLLAMAFDTNGIGVLNPFQKKSEPQVYAYVTDGMDRPPYFTWSEDGTRIYIEYNINSDDYTENDMGCWILIENMVGDVAKYAKSGVPEKERSEKVIESQTQLLVKKYKVDMSLVNCFCGMDDVLITVGQDTVSFYRPKETQVFIDRNPSYDSPLMVSGKDLAIDFDINPAFGIQLGKDEEWGLAFETGVVIAPDSFDAEKYLGYSLGRKYFWPIKWCETLRFNNLSEAIQDKKTSKKLKLQVVKQTQTSDQVTSKIPASSKNSNWPPIEGKTIDDLFQICFDTNKEYDSWSDEILIKLGVNMTRSGHTHLLFPLIEKISKNLKAYACAQFYFFAHQHNLNKEISDNLLKMMDEYTNNIEDNKAWPQIAKAWYFNGNTTKYKKYFQIALEKRKKLPEFNVLNLHLYVDKTDSLHCLDMIVFCQGAEEFLKYLKDFKFRGNGFDGRDEELFLFFNCFQYLPWDDLQKIAPIIFNTSDKSFYIINWLADRVVNMNQLEYLDKAEQLCNSQDDKDFFIKVVLKKLVENNHPEKFDYIQKKIKSFSPFVFSLMHLLLKENPDFVQNCLESINWDFKKFESFCTREQDRLKLAYDFSCVVHTLKWSTQFDKYFNKSESEGLSLGYQLGKIVVTDSENALNALTKIINFKYSDNYFKQYILSLVAAAVFKYQVSNYIDIQDLARLEMMKIDKYLGIGEMLDLQAQEGDFSGAYLSLMKVPKRSRSIYTLKLLDQLCKRKNIDGVYSILINLDPEDLSFTSNTSFYAINFLFLGGNNSLRF